MAWSNAGKGRWILERRIEISDSELYGEPENREASTFVPLLGPWASRVSHDRTYIVANRGCHHRVEPG